MFRINSKRYLVYVYNALSGDCNGKYTKILRHSEIIAPITAVRRIRADIFGRSAPVQEESGQSQFAPLKLRSLALVPASSAQGADADFHFNLPRRRDSPPSCPLRSPEDRETLQGPRTPAPLASAQKIPTRPAMASSGSCAASG